ncbi:hypothetical protein [Desulfopila aestuarii]|uniref:Uncharacterized protein n=1 Tax=Desulfopila aestuarii DSM 18488 TaxID=1121416 RepID=A0A1M7YAM4_9BACT|nr:hypothetical protein [Desulfopila aestuarii]SHO49684.1 hypothetical protein SAMN02745220_03007 [Desulfopila aestuarii DSM 18488]
MDNNAYGHNPGNHSYDDFEKYIERGRKLHSRAVAESLLRIAGWVRHPFRKSASIALHDNKFEYSR